MLRITVSMIVEIDVMALMFMLKLSVRLDAEGVHVQFFPAG